MTAEKKRSLLNELIADSSRITKKDSDHPTFVNWRNKVERTLKKIYGAESSEYKQFNNLRFFYAPLVSVLGADHSRQHRECFDRDFRILKNSLAEFLREIEDDDPTSSGLVGSNDRRVPFSTSSVFIVHGHDNEMKEAVARCCERLGVVAIILHEQANQGATLIEKLEQYGDVGFAVVLLSPDDMGFEKSMAPRDPAPRARQNVILELGYFIGRLGRNRVCALRRGKVEKPSDFDGVVYTEFDELGSWRFELGRELRAAGYQIDLNQLA